MNAVGTLVKGGVYTLASNFQPFGGAVDIMVVRQKDGTYRGSPFYVCFPVLFPLDRVMSRKDRTVDVYVRGKKVDLVMRVGADGHAYFPTTATDEGDAEAEEETSVAALDDDASSVASVDVRRCPSETLPSTAESPEEDNGLPNGLSPISKVISSQGHAGPAGVQSTLTRDMSVTAAGMKQANAAAFSSASAVLQHTSVSDASSPIRKGSYRDDLSADEPGGLGFVKELCKRLWQTPSTAFRSIRGSGGSSAIGYMDGDEDEYVSGVTDARDAVSLVQVSLEIVKDKQSSARGSPGSMRAVDVDARSAMGEEAELATGTRDPGLALSSSAMSDPDSCQGSPNSAADKGIDPLAGCPGTGSSRSSPPLISPSRDSDVDEDVLVVRVQITPKPIAAHGSFRGAPSGAGIRGGAALNDDSILCSTRDVLDESARDGNCGSDGDGDGDGSPPRTAQYTSRPLPAQSPSQLKAPFSSPQRRTAGASDGVMTDAMRGGGIGSSAPLEALPPAQLGDSGASPGLPPLGNTLGSKRGWGSWISPFSSPAPSPVPPRVPANASSRRPPLPDASNSLAADARVIGEVPGAVANHATSALSSLESPSLATWEPRQGHVERNGVVGACSSPQSPAEMGLVESASSGRNGPAFRSTACDSFTGVVRSSPELCSGVEKGVAATATTVTTPAVGLATLSLPFGVGARGHGVSTAHLGSGTGATSDAGGQACSISALAAGHSSTEVASATTMAVRESLAVAIPRPSLSCAISGHRSDDEDASSSVNETGSSVRADPPTGPHSATSASSAGSPLNNSGEWPHTRVSSSLPEGAAATRWWAGEGSLPSHGGGAAMLASAANGATGSAGAGLFGCACGAPALPPKLRLEVSLVPGWRRLAPEQLAVAFEEGVLQEQEFVREWERVMDSDSLVCRFLGGHAGGAGQILPWRQAAPMMVQFLAWGLPPPGGAIAGAVSTQASDGMGGAAGTSSAEASRMDILDDSSGDVLASNFGYSDGEGDGGSKSNSGARGGAAPDDASSGGDKGGMAPRQRYSYRQTYFPWLFGAPQKQSASLRSLPKLADPGDAVTGGSSGEATGKQRSGGIAAVAFSSSKSVLMSARAGSGLLSTFTGRGGGLSVTEVATATTLSAEEADGAGGLSRRTQSLTNAKFSSSPTQGAAPRARRRKALDKRIEKLYVATSEQLASLGLEEGRNTVSFMLPRILGMHQVTASIYLWTWNSRIVITDIDGTITRSDVLGHLMPIVGRDWSQNDVTGLFSCIRDNGFKLMYLSARALAQANRTRQYIANLKQGKNGLPEGPIIISPDGVFPSLYREVIKRRPQEFKIECLKRIRALFPPEAKPFYAGLGNRATDEESYMAVGIPRGKIFTINHKGEVRSGNLQKSLQSYASLKSLADEMFPHVKTSETVNEQEDFNEWNYWKVDLPVIDIDD